MILGNIWCSLLKHLYRSEWTEIKLERLQVIII